MRDAEQDIRRWRACADELRGIADSTVSASAKEQILKVARGYEIMADEINRPRLVKPPLLSRFAARCSRFLLGSA